MHFCVPFKWTMALFKVNILKFSKIKPLFRNVSFEHVFTFFNIISISQTLINTKKNKFIKSQNVFAFKTLEDKKKSELEEFAIVDF